MFSFFYVGQKNKQTSNTQLKQLLMKPVFIGSSILWRERNKKLGVWLHL